MPIISIGNLIVGGSGKTPFGIHLAKKLNNVAIILRGYKRESSGLLVVSLWGDITCNVKQSGDEAMLYAQSLKNSLIIVSNDRILAINKAKELGAKVIILDDGFSKINIKKFNILIKPNPEPKNSFLLPSGPYRELKSFYKTVDLVACENINFKKLVSISEQSEKMLLVSAIANPKRLDTFLPKNLLGKIYFKDHYRFKENELKKLFEKYGATSILTTRKDAVKMVGFNLPLSILELEIDFDESMEEKINNYIATFK